MGAAAGALGLFAAVLHKGLIAPWSAHPSDLVHGAISAGVLWAVFAVGSRVVYRLFPSAQRQTAAVYTLSSEVPRAWVAALLLTVVGPGEELYWRGLIQWNLEHLLPLWAALVLAALLYAAVHLVTRNPMLVLAALVCGLYWGGLYAIGGRIAPLVVSHALWDALVLLWLPLQTATETPVRPTSASRGN